RTCSPGVSGRSMPNGTASWKRPVGNGGVVTSNPREYRIPHSKSKPSTHSAQLLHSGTMSRFTCVTAVLMTPSLVYGQGLMTAIAGSGDFTFPASANGGPAIRAPLRSVTGVAVDSAGNVFASDTENNMVVRVSRSGILTIVAGTGNSASFASSGDGGP